MRLHPKQEEALKLAQSEKYNFILYGGAIRGGKTIWGLSALLILCEIFPGSRWAVIRENLERIRETTIPSFEKMGASGMLRQNPYKYTHPNSSVILFMGENYAKDKEMNAFKGLEVNGFLFEEINECQEQTFNKAFERAGSWIIKNTDIQPKPIVLATCNPTNGWVKDRIYDKWKTRTLPIKWAYVPAKITDNPSLPVEYIENLKNLPKYEYEVFVLGNWGIQLKTGGEFLKSFELEQHVRPVKLDINNTIHVSIDSNVLPYISVSVWQIEKEHYIDFTKYHCIQVNELPARDPMNTARKSALNLANWLKDIGYNDVVFMYGDPTTKNSNNIDDDKKSFFDLFTGTLNSEGYQTRDKMSRSNKSVSSMGDFVNAIFEGKVETVSITIGENNKVSINDYIETKQDKDGGILKRRETDPKTKTSFEPNGHIVDNLKDLICQAFSPEFDRFKRRINDVAPIIGHRKRAY